MGRIGAKPLCFAVTVIPVKPQFSERYLNEAQRDFYGDFKI